MSERSELTPCNNYSTTVAINDDGMDAWGGLDEEEEPQGLDDSRRDRVGKLIKWSTLMHVTSRLKYDHWMWKRRS